MAIFIESPPLAPALALPALSAAAASERDLPALPAAAPPVNLRYSGETTKESAELNVYWGRLIFASLFLLVILVGGFIAAILKLNDWSTLLIHSFELLLGIFIGLLGGDIAAKKAS
jgi:hypothetical protein